MKTFRLQILILLILITVIGCENEEIPPPDICGIYTGTRTYKVLSNEIMTIDIQAISKNGITGIIKYSNSTQRYTCAFDGEWNENDSDVDIYFYETKVIEKVNCNVNYLFNLTATFDNDEIAGTMVSRGIGNIFFSAKRSSPVPEIPIEDPDNPITPDVK